MGFGVGFWPSVAHYLSILRDKSLSLELLFWLIRRSTVLQSLRAAVRSMPRAKDPAWHTGNALEYQLSVSPVREWYPGPGWKTAEDDGNAILPRKLRWVLSPESAVTG